MGDPPGAGADEPGALPRPATPFVGRRRELAMIAALVREVGVRLLTLTGPPGAGKTWLALEAAAGLAPHFDVSPCFVPLAGVPTADQVPHIISRALGLPPPRGAPTRVTPPAALRDRRALLVLDNFEHLLPAAPFVEHLLDALPRATALVTSRAPLNTPREHTFPVLPLPDAQDAGAEAAHEPGGLEPGGRVPERSPLTDREREVAALVARGLTNQEIAHALSVSKRTVENHMRHILAKLRLRTRTQLALWAATRPAATPRE